MHDGSPSVLHPFGQPAGDVRMGGPVFPSVMDRTASDVSVSVPTTISDRLQIALKRLEDQLQNEAELCLRLHKFADNVLGPYPKPSNPGEKAMPEQPSLIGRLEQRLDLHGRILGELREIAVRLGA